MDISQFKHKNVMVGIVGGLFLFFLMVLVLWVAKGPSVEELDRAKAACENFVQERFEKDTQIFGTWRKKGKIVVKVGYRKKYRGWIDDDSYTIRLCVVDMKKGSLTIPSVFGMSEWEK